ncbi:MAG: hypothetical protein ACU85V_18535 [Gammaproteobacteria bacterium]
MRSRRSLRRCEGLNRGRRPDGHIEVSGSLEQYLSAPTLPTGLACDMADHRQAVPRFVVGRRAAAPGAS